MMHGGVRAWLHRGQQEQHRHGGVRRVRELVLKVPGCRLFLRAQELLLRVVKVFTPNHSSAKRPSDGPLMTIGSVH